MEVVAMKSEKNTEVKERRREKERERKRERERERSVGQSLLHRSLDSDRD
jgi:hypothetical protein